MLSGEQIAVYSDDITIECDNSLTFQQPGGLKLKLTPGAVEVKGKMKVEAKELIDSQAGMTNITK